MGGSSRTRSNINFIYLLFDQYVVHKFVTLYLDSNVDIGFSMIKLLILIINIDCSTSINIKLMIRLIKLCCAISMSSTNFQLITVNDL